MARSAQWHTSPDRHVNRISCMQLGYAAALPTEAPVFGYQFTPGGLETWPSTRADSGTDRVSNSLETGHCRRWARFFCVAHVSPGTRDMPLAIHSAGNIALDVGCSPSQTSAPAPVEHSRKKGSADEKNGGVKGG
ncbi:hypothetical protein V8C34DRAFT_272194 [Trichoderma compactum]